LPCQAILSAVLLDISEEDFSLWTFTGAKLARYKILSADIMDAAQFFLLAK